MPKETQYVPILKWKRAEQHALTSFPASQKETVVPLIEVVLPTVQRHKDKEQKVKKTNEEMLSQMVKKYREERIVEIPVEIKNCWGVHPIYLDFSLIHNGKETTELKVEGIKTIIPTALDAGLLVIPVVNINDDEPIKKAVSFVIGKYSSGVCVRIGASDLEQIEKANEKLKKFVLDMGVDISSVDVLVDLKNIQDGVEYTKLFNASQRLVGINKWRRFIFASGAFPVDLSKCKLDEPTMLPRYDWQNWVSQTFTELSKKPIYSDYTIRTPLFDESLQFYRATKSIKYTLENNWYVMKGTVNDSASFLVNAKLLVESSGHFQGEEFSPGDKYILEKAKYFDLYIKDPSVKGTGTNETWIEAGISHHLALVVSQVSNLGKKLSPVLSRSKILD